MTGAVPLSRSAPVSLDATRLAIGWTAPGSSIVPLSPILQPRSESERRRLAEIVPATDNAPTVISAKRPIAGSNGSQPDDLRGRRLGHFELAESLGVGGMAAVLKATDLIWAGPSL